MVLHIINGEFYAGAERVQDLLAINLPSFGYEVGFACLKSGIFESFRQAKFAPLETFKMSNGTDLSVVHDIVRTIKTHKYKVIHTHTPRTAVIGQIASLFTGCPMIHHIHGPTNLDTESSWRNRRNAVIERLSLMRAKAFIPVSMYAKNYATSIGLSNKKINIVFNGVPTPKQSNPLISRTPFIIGTMALFRPKKGIEVLIEAFAKLENPLECPLYLNMVGEFESLLYEKSIKTKARELGVGDRINWIGFTDDVYSQLDKMSIFVLPSLYGEGMPMVILEAMAAGVPIVATQIGGINEMICNGTDGLLIKPGDPEAIHDALKSLLNNSSIRFKLGNNARQKQIELFSDYIMAKKIAHIYDDILSN